MAENKENLLIEVGVSDKAAGPLGEIGREVERLSAVIEKAFAPKTAKTEFERQGETAVAARALLEGYIAKLAEERALIGLSSEDRQVAIARRNAEAVAIKGGITDHTALVNVIERELRANQSLTASLQAQIAQQAESAQADARRITSLREDIQARAGFKAQLDAVIPSIQAERALLKLSSDDRVVAIARRNAEALAIKAQGADHSKLIDQIEREIRENLKLQKSSTGLAQASSQASSALFGAGATIAREFGPAGTAIFGVSSHLFDAAGGAEQLALKAGLSASSLLSIGVAVGSVVAVATALGAVTKEALDLERALKQVRLRTDEGSGQLDKYRDLLVDLADTTGKTTDELAAGLGEVFASGGIKDSTAATKLLVAGLRGAILGFGDMAAVVRQTDTILDGFQLTEERAIEVQSKLFVAAKQAGAGFAEYADGVGNLSIVSKTLGVSLDDTIVQLAVVASRGVNAGKASQQLQQILLQLVDTQSPLHKTLVGMQVDLSRTAFEAKGLVGVFADIRTKLALPENLGKKEELFGGVRVAQTAFAALEDNISRANDVLRLLPNSTEIATAKIKTELDQVSSRIDQAIERVKTFGLTYVGLPVVDIIDKILPKESLSRLDQAKGILEGLLGLATLPIKIAIESADKSLVEIAANLKVKPDVEIPDVPDIRDILEERLKALSTEPINVQVPILFTVKEDVDATTKAIQAQLAAMKDLSGVTAALTVQSLDGIDKQVAAADEIIRQYKERIALAKANGAEEKELAAAIAALDRFEVKTAERIDDTAQRQVTELEAQALALRAQSVEKAAQLQRIIGNVVAADRLDVEAINARAEAARVAAALELEARTKQLEGNAAAIEAQEELYRLKLEGIAADREGARLALQRAASERSRAQRSEISGLEVDLLSGLDQELAAIERNRDARAQAANAEAGQFQEAARALNQKLGLLDLVAARDAAAAKLAAAGSNFDAIVTAVREVSDAYGFQAIAIHATREAERDRLEAALRGSNLEQAALNLTLALHDQATAKIKAAAAAQAALVPASVLAEIKLLQDAFEKAGGASLDFGTATVEQMQKVLDATLAAKNGMEALTAGLKAGAEDAKRVFADDLAFGIKAGSDQLFAFRDAAAEAFASIGEGSSVLRDFVTANLKALQQNISLIAANKLSSAIFGKPEGNKAAGVDPSLALQDAGHVLSFAGNELTIAAHHLASITFGPGSPSAVALTPQPEPLAFGVSGPPVAGSENFIGPIPDAVDEAAGVLANAGESVKSSLVSGASAAGAIAVSSSENAAAVFLAQFLGGIGQSAAGGLTKILGFQHGGYLPGTPIRTLYPKANAFGGVYSQRTLIEVAEVPGKTEAVVPLVGGEIPVTIKSQPERRQRGLDVGELAERAGAAIQAKREARERDERADRRRDGARVVEVGRRIEVNLGGITIEGSRVTDAASFGDELLGQMPRIRREIANALNSGDDRTLINAVREAIR